MIVTMKRFTIQKQGK